MERKYRDLFKRATGTDRASELYTEDVIPDTSSDERRYFYTLYSDCFHHHIQPNLIAAGANVALAHDDAEKRLIESDSISAYFIENLYETPTITATLNRDPIDRKRCAVNYEEFLAKISSPANIQDFATTGNPGSNRVSFMVGNIGMGKSLLAAKTINDIRKASDLIGNTRTIPIYIDFEQFFISPSDPSDFSDVGHRYFEHLYKRTRETLYKAGLTTEELDIARTGPDIPVYNRFRNLSKGLLNLDRQTHLFFVFDNLDRYHFFYSDYIFFRKYRIRQTARVVTNLSELMSKFSDSHYLGDCAFTVLMVCRKMTLSCWPERNSTLSPHKLHVRDFNIFSIDPIEESPDSENTGEEIAVNSRLKLLEHCASTIAEAYPDRSKVYDKYLESVKKTRADIELSLKAKKRNSLRTVAKLSQQGTRSFIDFVGSLKIDLSEDSDIADRLFREQPHNLLRLYITDLKKKFRESEGHFPNLFLVDATVRKKHSFRKAHRAHIHTYWLKYLLLKTIVDRTVNEGSIITEEELQEEFVGVCGYEPHLFRLMLGSLNSPNHFRCIEVSGSPLEETLRLKPTIRGCELVGGKPKTPKSKTPDGIADTGTEMCFDFDYLQFVIDDDALSIPEKYFDDVFVEYDIGYMLRTKSAYSAELRSYVIAKFSAVLNFCRILEASLVAERNHRLDRSQLISSKTPDFNLIFESLMSSYKRITPHLPNNKHLVEEAEILLRKLRGDTEYDKYFNDYYTDPVKVKAS